MLNNKNSSNALRKNLLRRKEYSKNLKEKPTEMKKIYEGKAKILFQSDNPDQIIQYFKDDATAFNNQKKEVIQNKGILNNYISEFIMNVLSTNNISNHFIKRIDDRHQLVKKLEIFPLEVIIRNISAGSICKRLGIEQGATFQKPIFEICYKEDSLGDPVINEDHAINALKVITQEQLNHIKEQAFKINEILKDIFTKINIRLVDFKIEFGFDSQGNIMLADEISPDSCRLWDSNTNERFDKDLFRHGLGDLVSGYREIANRLAISIP